MKKKWLRIPLAILTFLVALSAWVWFGFLKDAFTGYIKIDDINSNEELQILEAFELTLNGNEKVSDYQVKHYVNRHYCVLTVSGIDDMDDFVQRNPCIVEVKEFDKSFTLRKNLRYATSVKYGLTCYVDEDCVYLSIDSNSYILKPSDEDDVMENSQEFADVFWEIYNERLVDK